MDPCGDTLVLPKKSRQARKQELYDVLEFPDGETFLTHLYRHHFPSRPGGNAPPVPVMIIRILSKEFPD